MARKKLELFTEVVRYPVLADLGLYAVVGGYHTMNIWRQSQTPEEIMHKFAHCFRKVWEQMPGGDCGTLITYWGLRGSNESSTFSSDIISLEWKLKFHSPYSFYRGKYDYALGQCDLSGLHLYFSTWFIKRAGSGDLEYLIAHELGHAISFARGWFKHHACDDDAVICTACECEADRYLRPPKNGTASTGVGGRCRLRRSRVPANCCPPSTRSSWPSANPKSLSKRPSTRKLKASICFVN